MNEIGGYFELNFEKKVEHHKNCLKLNTGRNCLRYILLARKLKKLYLPFYICDQLLEPLKKLRIDFEYYFIDQNLNPILNFEKVVSVNEAVLVVNYFGIKQLSLRKFLNTKTRFIVDNTQAFFSEPVAGMDTFYSARKFFGVPDGAYLFTDSQLENAPLVQGTSYQRTNHLIKRADCSAEFGYADFRMNESQLENIPIEIMSKLSESILMSIDYANAKKRREENFNFLHEKLEGINGLKIESADLRGPMAYPFFVESKTLRKRLVDNRVYVPKYWEEVRSRVEGNSVEARFSDNLLALPVDHRYTLNEMKFILSLI